MQVFKTFMLEGLMKLTGLLDGVNPKSFAWSFQWTSKKSLNY